MDVCTVAASFEPRVSAATDAFAKLEYRVVAERAGVEEY